MMALRVLLASVALTFSSVAAQNCGYLLYPGSGMPFLLDVCQAEAPGSVGFVPACANAGADLTLTNYSTATCEAASASAVITAGVSAVAAQGLTVVCDTGSTCPSVVLAGYKYPPNCATGAKNASTVIAYTLAGGVCAAFGANTYHTWECTATGATRKVFSDNACQTMTGSLDVVPGCNDAFTMSDGTSFSMFFSSLCGKNAPTPSPVTPATPSPVTPAPTTKSGAGLAGVAIAAAMVLGAVAA